MNFSHSSAGLGLKAGGWGRGKLQLNGREASEVELELNGRDALVTATERAGGVRGHRCQFVSSRRRDFPQWRSGHKQLPERHRDKSRRSELNN